MKTPKPPTKLSDLIDLAVRDGERLDPNVYVPNAGVWHEPAQDEREQCYVCLAGAVIAGTLGANPAQEVRPSEFPKWNTALVALDHARKGDYAYAIDMLKEGTVAGSMAFLSSMSEEEQLKIGQEVPIPDHSEFQSMDSFLDHLKELEDIAEALRRIGY